MISLSESKRKNTDFFLLYWSGFRPLWLLFSARFNPYFSCKPMSYPAAADNCRLIQTTTLTLLYSHTLDHIKRAVFLLDGTPATVNFEFACCICRPVLVAKLPKS